MECPECARLRLKIRISTPPQSEAWQRLLEQHELTHRPAREACDRALAGLWPGKVVKVAVKNWQREG
jgi:hypothetical protein